MNETDHISKTMEQGIRSDNSQTADNLKQSLQSQRLLLRDPLLYKE